MRTLLSAIHRITTKKWRIMEVCGGQTYALSRYRIEELLPEKITMLHGPGCPVCVTPAIMIDRALELASRPEVIFCTFGDMMRVPGSRKDLIQVKSEGGDVRMIYSPLDTLKIATDNPKKEVIFFAIGFETTTPIYALLIQQAQKRGIKNFSLLTAIYTIPAAIDLIAGDTDSRVNGLLAAGHVCAVTGTAKYKEIAARHKLPVTVTGFEPVDLLYGIYKTIKQLEEETCRVENGYSRVVSEKGNPKAWEAVQQFFKPYDSSWRGLGEIPGSGLILRPEYEHYNAEKRFIFTESAPIEKQICRAGKIMRGLMTPKQCPAFGKLCTPDHPEGAPMVSSEGVCSAYYRYNH